MPRAAKRLASIAANLALSATSIVSFLLLAEVLLRLLGYTPERYGAFAHVANGRRTVFLDCYPDNPRHYFDIDLRDPAVRARYLSLGVSRVEDVAFRTPWAVECRYNALRFRDAELGPKATGTRRVLVLGDSFTEAQGVKEGDTLPRVLERLLNAGSREGWEVRNCGRRATDFPALYETFERLLAFEPDIVVYAMVLNDPERSPSFEARQPYLNDWIVDMDRMRESGPVALGFFRSRLAAFAEDRARRYRIGRETTRWYLDMYTDANREGWQRTQFYIKEMNARMRSRGGHLLVASWPLLIGLEGAYPFAEVDHTIERFCLAAGVPRVDLLAALRGHPSASLWVHPVDRHPNEVANRIAAEALVGPLREIARSPENSARKP